MDETSQPLELLVAVSRDGGATLGAQIEDQLRHAVRDGVLRPGARIASTRDLARQLGISRRVVVDAYAQLAAEGYLTLRQGARPLVAGGEPAAPAPRPTAPCTTDGAWRAVAPAPAGATLPHVGPAGPPPRYDLRPSVPDVSTFPRAAWLKCLREALAEMTDADLRYGDPRGVEALREALTDYLGRVRGVAADPGQVVVTSGYTQGLGLVCHALRTTGATSIVIEDPCNPEQAMIARRAGLEPIPVGVDDEGLRTGDLPVAGAVVLTPAHQHPTGAVLSGERRTRLLEWLERHGAIAIEDDYDAEYRYDRAAVGALQGLAPQSIVYAGSTSKTLAPALRLGWLVTPPILTPLVAAEKHLADQGSPGLEQHAFARFLARGELDRHLRRMRARYRARRDALIGALAEALPEATVGGVAAGLHVTLVLPPDTDEPRLRAEASERRIAFNTTRDYREDGPPALMLGYANLPEAGLRAAARELGAAVAAART